MLQEGLMGQKPSNVEELLKQSQKEMQWLQRLLSFLPSGEPGCVFTPSKVSPLTALGKKTVSSMKMKKLQEEEGA